MSIKFSISTITIAALLTLAHTSIATAEVYKTSKGQVIVTGLTSKQSYPVKTVNAKSKAGTRNITANTCGEALIDGAAKYKSLVVGTETIEPATLTTKVHARCNGNKKAATAPAPKKSKKSPATATTGTVTPSTTPTAVPTMAPTTK